MVLASACYQVDYEGDLGSNAEIYMNFLNGDDIIQHELDAEPELV